MGVLSRESSGPLAATIGRFCSARTAANDAFDSGHGSIPVLPASTLTQRQGMQAATCRLTASSTSRPHVIRNALREYTMSNSVPGSQGGGS